jgi:hypothetical protein
VWGCVWHGHIEVVLTARSVGGDGMINAVCPPSLDTALHSRPRRAASVGATTLALRTFSRSFRSQTLCQSLHFLSFSLRSYEVCRYRCCSSSSSICGSSFRRAKRTYVFDALVTTVQATSQVEVSVPPAVAQAHSHLSYSYSAWSSFRPQPVFLGRRSLANGKRRKQEGPVSAIRLWL